MSEQEEYNTLYERWRNNDSRDNWNRYQKEKSRFFGFPDDLFDIFEDEV